MADTKKNSIIVDDMRDYALVTLLKIIRRLELVDHIIESTNQEDEDLLKFRRYVSQIAHKTINLSPTEITPEKQEKIDKLLIRYPEIFDIAAITDKEKGGDKESEQYRELEKEANNITKDLLKKCRKAILNSAVEYQKLTEDYCESVMIDAEKVYAEVFGPEIKKHNNARRNKNNPDKQINTGQFIKSVMEGDINKDIKDIIGQSKKRIIEALKDRKKDARKSAFQEDINDLLPGMEIVYATSGNTIAVRQANAKVRSYFSAADANSYLDRIKKDAEALDNKTKKEKDCFQEDRKARSKIPGTKEDFLQLLGNMAAAGYSQIHLGIEPTKQNFENFVAIVRKNYPQNTDEDISKALGISPKANKEARIKAFNEKCASVYTQMLGGFMQLRSEIYPNETINSNIIRSLKSYIDGMMQGKQDIQAMAFLDPAKDHDHSTGVKQQQSQEQHTNVDHKIPVASAITLYIRLHPERGGALDPNKLQLSQLLKLAELAAPLVNNISNHRQVIGRTINQLLEPNGAYVLDNKKDNSILATSYNAKQIKEKIDIMPGLSPKEKERYYKAFSQYSKADNRGIIMTTLNLPEHQDISRARKANTPKRNKSKDIRILTENALLDDKSRQ